MSSNEFYTHSSVKQGKVFYRGYEIKDGVKKRVHGKVSFKPTLYIESNEKTEFQSIYGKPLRERKLESISAAREFVKQYDSVYKIHGYAPSRWGYEFIARNFPDVLSVGISDLKIIGWDIETKVNVNGPPGVPDPFKALEEITHIAFQDRNTLKTTCFTTADVVLEEEDGYYEVLDSEEELLERIITFIEVEDPDIMYGFYCEGFDTPYLINRIRNVLGEEAANRLSPFGVIDEREVEVQGSTRIEYNIVGRTMYDLQALYKKFVLKKQESYSLDHLAKVELGVGKLENPFNTFKEFCESEEHKNTFARYNIIDTKRMTEIDQKKGLLSIGVSVAYLTKSNYEDVYSPVRYWECYIASTLLKENKYIAVSRESRGGGAIPGAYVAEPVPGFYEWVVSIDATALYPSIMQCLNLSPETFQGMVPNVTVDSMLEGKTLVNFGVTDDVTLAANGASFSRDKIGFVPRIIEKVLGDRRVAKNEMLRLKQLYVDTGDKNFKNESDLKNVLQEALKVMNNSLYGVFLQPGFIFYDARFGEAITLTGQYIIKTVSSHCDKSFNEFFKTSGIPYVIYMDTDSVFFTLKNVVEKYWKGQPDLKIVDALDTLMEKKLRPYIDEATDTIARVQNHYVKTIYFKRENVCSGGFWLGKKRYALKVYDSEGVRFPEGDYKIMGIEVVRSSTPMLVRNALKADIALIIDKNLEQLKINVAATRASFDKSLPSVIAFPSSANNLVQYTGTDKPYAKGCPIGPRASLLYNSMLERHNLFDRYDKINEGDKMKFIYLKLPNPLQENVIAFVDELPVEFGLHKYIDIDTQYEKTYMKPLSNILEAVGWELEEKASLDSFF